MAKNTNDILFRFLADTKSLNRGTKDATKQLKGVDKGINAVTRAAGAMAVAFGAAKVGQFAGDAIQLAIAAEEVDSKFQAVFGTATELNDALREWGDIAGVTETSAKDMAATFGNLAMAQGISAKETEALTLQVAQLAGDMGSFNDIDPEQVFFDLNKALLTTEREGMKKYGIALTETEIKQRALDIAVADGRTEFTKGDKALASYQIAVEQAGVAVGDLDRTSESLANRQRQLKATIEETQEEIGKELLPAYEDMLEVVIDLLPAVGGLTKLLANQVGDTAALVGQIDDVTDSTERWDKRSGDLIATWLRWFSSGIADDLAASWDNWGESGDEAFSTFITGSGEMEAALIRAGGRGREALEQITDELDSQNVKLNVTSKEAWQTWTEAIVRAAQRARGELGTVRVPLPGGGFAEIEAGTGTGGGLFKAQGGTIQPGQTSMVGEHGPEMISPRGGAHITPAHRSGGGGGGGITINVEFSGVVGDPTAVAEQITDLLEQYQRTNVSF